MEQPTSSYGASGSQHQQAQRQSLKQRLLAGLKSSLRTAVITARTLPPTTTFVILLCLAIEFLALIFSGLESKGCLSARGYVTSPVFGFPRLLTNHFVHVGILHVVLNLFAWPAVAVPAETALGSVQFAHVVLLLAAVDSAIYVLLGLVFGIFVSDLATDCSAGLSSLIFALLTIEASHQRGFFETLHLGSFEVPGKLFPWIIFGLSSIVYPWASFVGHLSGILAGTLFVYKLLDFLLLPTRVLDVLENGRMCASLVQWSTFVPHQSAVSLPTSGRDVPGGRGGGFSFGNPFRSSGGARYAPVGNLDGPDDGHDDDDPLLWNEDEEEQDLGAATADAAPNDVLVDVAGDEDELLGGKV